MVPTREVLGKHALGQSVCSGGVRGDMGNFPQVRRQFYKGTPKLDCHRWNVGERRFFVALGEKSAARNCIRSLDGDWRRRYGSLRNYPVSRVQGLYSRVVPRVHCHRCARVEILFKELVHYDLEDGTFMRWQSVVEKNMPEALMMLQTYCQQPSIAAQGIGIQETVEFLRVTMDKLGGHVSILSDCGGNPVVFAEFEPGEHGDSNKTILFYNHYDVQPPEPLEEWNVPPFGAVISDGKLFARGAADNKADLAARLQAVALLQQNGGLPCRVKFFVEGEEEIGSVHLEKYIEKYADLLQADACIWETWGRNAAEIVEMVAGVKGICYVQFTCKTAEVDLHSGLGSIADNAGWRLTKALSSMRGDDFTILVDGFYDDVIPPTPKEREMVDQLSVNIGDALRDAYGVKSFIAEYEQANHALIFNPSISLCGIESGYNGEGAKTVVPKRAQAKLECRLVPNQDPIDIMKKIRKHLDNHGYADIEMEYLEGYPAYRSNVDHPFVDIVRETAQEAYGSSIEMWPNAEGSGPMYMFGKHLGNDLPIVSTGCGWWGCNGHAPNESIRVKDYEEGILHMVLLLEKFGQHER